MLYSGYLVDRGAADLAHPLGDAVHAVQVGLAELAAVRVERQLAVQLQVSVRDEMACLAPAAEAQLLQLDEHERREMVVEHGDVHIGRPDARLLPQAARHHTHLGQAGQVVAVVAGHRELVGAAALRRGFDDRGFLRQGAGAFGGGDDERDAAVALLAAVEEPEWFGDPAGRLVVVERDRPVVEPRVGVRGGVLAVDHGDPAEVLRGGAVGVHVAAGEHGDHRGRGAEAHRVGPAVVDVRGGGRLHLAEPVARAFVERPIADHDLRHPGLHGHDGLLDGRTGRPAAVVHPAEERQLRDAELTGDRDLGVGVHGEADESVHIGGFEAGVVECVADRLGGELELASPGLLGELGRADADDRGVHAGTSILTVPTTWSP